MPNRPVRVWLDLPSELETAVKAAGRQEHLSRDETIRRACEEYVARHTVDQNSSRDASDEQPVEVVASSPLLRQSRGIASMAFVRQGV